MTFPADLTYTAFGSLGAWIGCLWCKNAFQVVAKRGGKLFCGGVRLGGVAPMDLTCDGYIYQAALNSQPSTPNR